MSVFSLKILALFCMLTDHLGLMLYNAGLSGGALNILLRSIGRPAFPIFAFLIANGFGYSSDRRKYALRLMLFALLSQLPYTLLSCPQNYVAGELSSALSFNMPLLLLPAAAALICCMSRRRPWDALILLPFMLLPGLRLSFHGRLLLNGQMNIFYTLSLSLLLLGSLSGEEKESPGQRVLLWLLSLSSLLIIVPCSDYGIGGLCLIVLFWLFRRHRALQCASALLWALMQYGLSPVGLCYFSAAALSLLPIALYTGRRGPGLKYFFYCFYPVHLLCLFIISRFLI